MSGAQTPLPAVPAPPERRPEADAAPRSRGRGRLRRRGASGRRARGDGAVARVVAPALLVLLLLGIWQLYATVGSVDDFILPAPTEVAQAMWEDRALLWDNLLVTAQEVGLGVLVALVLGFGLAVALHLSITLRRGTYPLLVASQAVPIVIIAPLLVVWFGFGIVPKLAIIALVCFFPVVVTTLDALGNVDPDQIKLLRTLDASRWQAFRYAEAPAALPAALSGAKIAVAVAVIGAVFAEYAGSSSGLGHLMLQAIPQLETARAYAAVVLLAAFAVTLFSALALAERRLVPWANRRPEGPRA
jgi:ABC-type nitrate/sulfonate/bicarbonate transport system permease component